MGEIVTILGPNGCGKSTLLKCLSGLVRVRGGEIRINGLTVTNVLPHEKVRRHRIGVVPQSDNVFASLTVAENVLLGARHLAPAERDQRYHMLMTQYPMLLGKQDRAASALSGGERQILSLARALISDPRVILLDEPSAGLSPLVSRDVFDAIALVFDRTGACILVVEQNATEALHIADRAYVLSLGGSHWRGVLLGDAQMRHLYIGASGSEAGLEPRLVQGR